MASARIASPTPSIVNQPREEDSEEERLFRRIRFADLAGKRFWIGDYDYRALLNPRNRTLPFFAPNAPLPVLLAILLGLQHALAMVGGLVVPPLLLGGASGAALSSKEQSYLVSAALLWCSIGTAVQVSRIPIGKGYSIGSGIITVIGVSFAFVNSALTYINNQYNQDDGLCSFDSEGNKLPCREAYGAILGTSVVVAPIAILMSFCPPKTLRRLFTPLITGSVLLLIGLSLMSSGITNWAGGSGCQSGGLCPSADAPHPATWGSPRLIGLGFSVWVSIILVDIFGPPLLKNMSTMIGLLIGIIIAAATGYFVKASIDSAPVVTFLWTTTFPLSVKGELVLPFIAAYLIVIAEGIGNITATSEVSRLPVSGPSFSSRVQGGLLSDSIAACLSGLATVPPTTTFSQNAAVVQLSNNASRWAGYACAGFLFIMGLFAKFGAVFVAMPASLIGGLTVFLFASVAVSGLRILSKVPWTRRTRFIATASLSLGFADIVNPDWFSNFFTYSGPNHSLRGFLDALTLVVSESYLITLLLGLLLQAVVPLGEDDLGVREEEEGRVLPTVSASASASGSGSKYGHRVDRVGGEEGEMPLEVVDSKGDSGGR
ncbi:hypothetical protein JCM6882_008563 [Rhodosporidiobolus microsporus]